MIGDLILAIAATFLSATFSGMETGLYSLQRARLRVRAAAGDLRAGRLLEIASKPGATVATILVLNNIVNYVVSFSTDNILEGLTGPEISDVERSMLATLWLTPILFIFGELMPKTVFLHRPSKLVMAAHPIFAPCAWLVQPITVPLLRLLRGLGAEGEGGAASLARPAVAEILLEEEAAAALTPAQREVATGLYALRQLRAVDRMVPWRDVITVSESAAPEEAVRTARKSGRKRLVLVDAMGRPKQAYVNVIEFAMEAPSGVRAADLGHAMPVVLAETPLLDVLQRLQSDRRALALVQDARGAPLGILTAAEISEGLLGIAAPLRRRGSQASSGRRRLLHDGPTRSRSEA